MRKDINLIPKKESTVSTVTITIILVLSLLLLFGISYYGVLKPNQNRDRLLEEIMSIEVEMQSYLDIEVEYGKLLEEVGQVKNSLSTIMDIQNHRILMSKVIKNLEQSLPSTAVLKTVSLQNKYLGIIGTSPGYEEISQFILKLRQLEYVQSVKLNSANYLPALDTDQELAEAPGYIFDITVELMIGAQSENQSEQTDNTRTEGGE